MFCMIDFNSAVKMIGNACGTSFKNWRIANKSLVFLNVDFSVPVASIVLIRSSVCLAENTFSMIVKPISEISFLCLEMAIISRLYFF